MGFIKQGDDSLVIEKVFDDVGDVLREIAEHTEPDSEPAVVTVPAAEPPDGEVN
jgi:hypothetical protein